VGRRCASCLSHGHIGAGAVCDHGAGRIGGAYGGGAPGRVRGAHTSRGTAKADRPTAAADGRSCGRRRASGCLRAGRGGATALRVA
jgi:hypothetical protein